MAHFEKPVHLTDSFPSVKSQLGGRNPILVGITGVSRSRWRLISPPKNCPTNRVPLKSSASSWSSLWKLPKNGVSTDYKSAISKRFHDIFPQDIPVSLLFKNAIFVGLSTNKQSSSTLQNLTGQATRLRSLKCSSPRELPWPLTTTCKKRRGKRTWGDSMRFSWRLGNL